MMPSESNQGPTNNRRIEAKLLMNKIYGKNIQNHDCPRCGGKGTRWGCKLCGKKPPTT